MNQPVTAKDIMSQSRREVASQATSIEQSRAIAEVQAAVTVALKFPRDETTALAKARASCAMWEVAEGAFYKFKRGNETVSDATIHLAVELARCWGNISYGIMELDRDEARQMSEMLAFAWDLETNTQSRMTFLVPHKRDTKQGVKALVDMRDIYENNANNGARRLRECIFRVLPPYLKEQAKQICRETLERGRGDKPLPVRISEAVEAFAKIGISRERLEAKIGKSATWTAVDIANLEVSYRSIGRQEISADEEFPRLGTEETVKTARALAEKAAGQIEDDGEAVHEGRDDSQRGEDHTDDDGSDQSPAAQKARELIRRAEACQTLAELDVLEAEAAPHLQFMEGDFPAWVEAAFGSATIRLGGAKPLNDSKQGAQ